MKRYLLIFLMLICLVMGKDVSLVEKMQKINQNFEDVKKFCRGKDTDFCSTTQIQMSLNVLTIKLKELQKKQREMLEQERKNRANRKKQRETRIKLAMNFLDRHF